MIRDCLGNLDILVLRWNSRTFGKKVYCVKTGKLRLVPLEVLPLD